MKDGEGPDAKKHHTILTPLVSFPPRIPSSCLQQVQAERGLAKAWVLASGQICSVDLAFQASPLAFTHPRFMRSHICRQ